LDNSLGFAVKKSINLR